MNYKSCSALATCGSIFLFVIFTACGTQKNLSKDFVYFQPGIDTVITQQKATIIRPSDILSIYISSRTLNQEQAAVFNLPNTGAGSANGYQVNNDGNIDLPVIGSIKAAGLTKQDLQASLLQKLSPYVKNPSVLVNFLEFNVNVLGEVRTPGIQKFSSDRVTLIDALGAAGDLTDFGRRENVTVIREDGNKKIYYTVDIRSRAFFESPVYILQPNDIVYVSPNKNKIKNISLDPEAQRKTSLIFAITSVVLSIGNLILLSNYR